MSYMRWGFLIPIWGNAQIFSPNIRRSLVIYDFAPDPSEFPKLWRKFSFLFYQCGPLAQLWHRPNIPPTPASFHQLKRTQIQVMIIVLVSTSSKSENTVWLHHTPLKTITYRHLLTPNTSSGLFLPVFSPDVQRRKGPDYGHYQSAMSGNRWKPKNI